MVILRILEDAETKLEAWRRHYPNAGDSNSPSYRRILEARGSDSSNVDANGHVTEQTLQLIKEVLRDKFDMYHQVGDTFPQKLSKKLQDARVKAILIRIRNLSICSTSLEDLKPDTDELYASLSAPGPSGLSFRSDHFCVGATKTMNFLFPELFVMLDRCVAKALCLNPYNKFSVYWSVLRLCHDDLEEWRNIRGSLDSLVALDVPPTTSVRIFDKCATVMGHSWL